MRLSFFIGKHAVANALDILADLKTSAKILDTIEYALKGVVTEQLLTRFIREKRLLAPGEVVNIVANGTASTGSKIISGLYIYLPGTDTYI